jgi:hypothetical protein
VLVRQSARKTDTRSRHAPQLHAHAAARVLRHGVRTLFAHAEHILGVLARDRPVEGVQGGHVTQCVHARRFGDWVGRVVQFLPQRLVQFSSSGGAIQSIHLSGLGGSKVLKCAWPSHSASLAFLSGACRACSGVLARRSPSVYSVAVCQVKFSAPAPQASRRPVICWQRQRLAVSPVRQGTAH